MIATTQFCCRLVILIASFIVCHPLIAAEAPSDDSLFYYKIGGGRDIAIPPSLNITTIDLSLSGQASALSCSGFPCINMGHNANISYLF